MFVSDNQFGFLSVFIGVVLLHLFILLLCNFSLNSYVTACWISIDYRVKCLISSFRSSWSFFNIINLIIYVTALAVSSNCVLVLRKMFFLWKIIEPLTIPRSEFNSGQIISEENENSLFVRPNEDDYSNCFSRFLPLRGCKHFILYLIYFWIMWRFYFHSSVTHVPVSHDTIEQWR